MAIERVRIYDLAREMGVPNKDLMTLLKDKLNITVKSHSSTISQEEADILRKSYSKEAKPTDSPPPPKEEIKPEPPKEIEKKPEQISIKPEPPKEIEKKPEQISIKPEPPKEVEKKSEQLSIKPEPPKDIKKVEPPHKPQERALSPQERPVLTQRPKEAPPIKDDRYAQQQRSKPTTFQQKPPTTERLYQISGDKYKAKPDNRPGQGTKPERYPGKKPSYGFKSHTTTPHAAATSVKETSTVTPEVPGTLPKEPTSETKELQIKLEAKPLEATTPEIKETETKVQTVQPEEIKPQEAKESQETTHPKPRHHEHKHHEHHPHEHRTQTTRPHEPRPHTSRSHEPRTQEQRTHQTSHTNRPAPAHGHQKPSRPFGNAKPDFRQSKPESRPIDKSKQPPSQKDAPSNEQHDPTKHGKPVHKKEQLRKKEYFQKEKFQDLKPLNEILKKKKAEKVEVPVEKPTEVTIDSPLTIAELGDKLVISPTEIIKELMKIGIFATLNQTISEEVAKDVSEKLEYTVHLEKPQLVKPKEELITKEKQQFDESKSAPRAPIVTIMGHVDHGKTTLLDSIRKTKQKIVDSEVGGITQSIGAYAVGTGDKRVVFIDTPGHQAFTAMRARGAQATDIAVLIVAADDGIMPQTIEAINHAKAAGVPIIVAINKVDKAGSDPDRILQQLTEHGLLPEAWGGDTVTVQISALKGDNIEDLLEMISLVSELQELKADPTANATGVVIESKLDKGKGPMATVLVQNGTLRVGDFISIGSVGGKIRALLNDMGERINEADPSTPVEILGLSEVPNAGDAFTVVDDDKTLKQIISKRKEEDKEKRLSTITPIQLQKDTIFKAKQKKDKDQIKELNIIIKADTNGSAKAVEAALQELKSKEITVKIIHIGIGDISEADVMLAVTSNSMIIGFRVKEDANAEKISDVEGVNIRTYEIIYQISEDIEKTMLGLLKPELKEVELGVAEVRNLFTVGKNLVIAGCYVLEGKIVRNKTATVFRENKEIFKGNLDNLKRFKDDAKEVNSGYECGISFNKFNDLKEGDIIKVTTFEEIERDNLN